jgi:hypothetical protein
MTLPVIAIARHKSGVYEWAIRYGSERMDARLAIHPFSIA